MKVIEEGRRKEGKMEEMKVMKAGRQAGRKEGREGKRKEERGR